MDKVKCDEHSDCIIDIANLENRLNSVESRIDKHSGKVDLAYQRIEHIVNKSDKLMTKIDELVSKSIQIDAKFAAHDRESGFWRGFVVTVAIGVALQLSAFIYAWGYLNSQVKENTECRKNIIQK